MPTQVREHLPCSIYIEKIKPEFENLLTELGKNKFFTDISILAEKSEGKTYRHSKSGTSINDNMFATTGAVIRLTTPAGLYEYSCWVIQQK